METLTLSFILYEGKVGPWGGMTCPRCQRSCRKNSAAELGVGPSVCPTVSPVVLPGMESTYIRAVVGRGEEEGWKEEMEWKSEASSTCTSDVCSQLAVVF